VLANSCVNLIKFVNHLRGLLIYLGSIAVWFWHLRIENLVLGSRPLRRAVSPRACHQFRIGCRYPVGLQPCRLCFCQTETLLLCSSSSHCWAFRARVVAGCFHRSRVRPSSRRQETVYYGLGRSSQCLCQKNSLRLSKICHCFGDLEVVEMRVEACQNTTDRRIRLNCVVIFFSYLSPQRRVGPTEKLNPFSRQFFLDPGLPQHKHLFVFWQLEDPTYINSRRVRTPKNLINLCVYTKRVEFGLVGSS